MNESGAPSLVQYAVPIFIVLVTVEILLFARGLIGVHGSRLRYDVKDTAASLAMGTGQTASGALVFGFVLSGAYMLHEYALFDLGWSWWVLILCFFIEDLSFYWSHRLSHEIRWFWASHVVHHSSQHYNLSTALRQNWTDMATGAWIFYIPIILIGFPIEMILMFRGASSIYQFWIHTESVPKLGLIEKVMNTASHHRVHHATNPEYLDRNHAGVLIIWDKLFGTFVEEREDVPIRYGIVKNIGTFNPLKIAFHEWVALIGDAVRAPGLKAKLGYIFGPPGWCHDGSRKTSDQIRTEWRERVAGQDKSAALVAAE